MRKSPFFLTCGYLMSYPLGGPVVFAGGDLGAPGLLSWCCLLLSLTWLHSVEKPLCALACARGFRILSATGALWSLPPGQDGSVLWAGVWPASGCSQSSSAPPGFGSALPWNPASPELTKPVSGKMLTWLDQLMVWGPETPL